MYLFTYKEYLRCTKPRGIYELREESAEYNLNIEQEETHQYKDKIFKEILSNKKEVINFLKKYFKDEIFEKLTEKDIEKYNKEFITSNFERQEADIIYQIPKENFYIIIEHQSKVDYNMPERMTKYCIELRRDIMKSSNKIFDIVICPIVLYTGDRKWNIDSRARDKEYRIKTFKYTEYNFVDINNEIEEKLVKEDTGMSKALLFEKINSKEELKETMTEILKKDLTKEEKEYITKILKYSNKIRKIMPEERKEYIKKLEEEGGSKEMKFEKYFIEWLEDEKREGREIGRQEGEKRGEKVGIAKAIKQIVKEMLQKQMSDKDIMDITKIDERELQKLKMA